MFKFQKPQVFLYQDFKSRMKFLQFFNYLALKCLLCRNKIYL
jgi:hypothetical protein